MCTPRWLVMTSVALFAWILLCSVTSAIAAPPTVYVTDVDDGVAPGVPIEITPLGSTVVYLYIDGGTAPSPEIRCAQGTGDEICGYDLAVQGLSGIDILDFVPEASVVFGLDANTLNVVGGDAWFGTLGPQKLGELTLQGASGGTLELLASESTNSSLGIDLIASATLATVPEPGLGIGLSCGVACLALLRRRRSPAAHARWRSVAGVIWAVATISIAGALSADSAAAQTSVDCGDVVSDGVIDGQDLAALLDFLASKPGAPDLQGDPAALARCDVSGDALCRIDDYSRIRRYMLDLTGGLNESCPLTGATFPPVMLPPPTVDQVSSISSARTSIVLTGTADPNDIIRVSGAHGVPTATTAPNGIWKIEVPLALGQANPLQVFREHGAGHRSESVPITVNQGPPTGSKRVKGRVVDEATGAPLPDVEVDLSGTTLITDSRGHFEFRGLPEGLVALRAEHPDYVPTLALAGAGIAANFGDELNREFDLVISLVPRQPPVTIGAGGGIVTTPGGIELVVPAGALPGDMEISLSEVFVASGLPFEPIELVDIGPGPIVFDPPATLRIPAGDVTPGTVIDFDRVDHSTRSVLPAIGVASPGFIEIPVDAVNGDGFSRLLRARRTSPNRTLEDLEVRQKEFALEAPCDGAVDSPVRIDDVYGAIAEPPWLFALGETPLSSLGETPELIALAYLAAHDLTPEYSPPVHVDSGNVAFVSVSYLVSIDTGELYESIWPEGGGTVTNRKVADLWVEQVQPVGLEIQAVTQLPNPACDKKDAGAWGDPHLIRFDHAGEAISHSRGDGRFDFQASGEFILFQSIEDDMVVQARMEPWNASTTVITAAAMDVDGDHLFFTSNSPNLEVYVNGTQTPLTVGIPITLPGGGEIERGPPWGTRNRDNATVRFTDGSEILIVESGYLNLFPNLSFTRAGRVKGLLGNANGVMVDDFNLRDGTPADPADKYTVFADSWRISQAESLFEYEPGEDTSTYNGTPVDEDYTPDDLDPAVRSAAEATCLAAGITDEPTLTDCIIDVAVVGNDAADEAAGALSELPHRGTYVAVPADANIFAAGLGTVPDFGGGGGNGSLPVELPLPAGSDRVLQVLDAAGEISLSATSGPIPPDGLGTSTVNWGSWGGYPGPQVSRTAISMGVFLDGSAPPATMPDAYQCGEDGGRHKAPRLGQIFCVGDGLSSFEDPQYVLVPDSATNLFLGFIDGARSQVLDTAVHHIGDNTISSGLFALAPSPEGTFWTSSLFDVPAMSVTGARVLIDLVQTNFVSNALQVNGQPAAFLPSTGPDDTQWSNDLVMTFDPSLLMPSGNTLTIVAAASGSNEDDFLFRNLRIEVDVATSQIVEAPVHYLGDQALTEGLFGSYSVEGTTWTSAPFDLTNALQAEGATFLIDLVQTNFADNEIYVNGVLAGRLPSTGQDATAWSSNLSVALAPLIFRETGNVISIVAVEDGSANTDDFLFRNVRVALEFNEGPPGGYGDNTGMHEFILSVE